jgi:uncharacterized membrane protein
MEVQDSILIKASLDVVWAVTADVERWPEWIPTVMSVRLVSTRELGTGSVARIKQPLQPESEWVVTDLRTGRSSKPVRYAAAGRPNQVVSASASPT